jgi:cell division protein ZapA (FtsZ GTPase activity inhibitor)
MNITTNINIGIIMCLDPKKIKEINRQLKEKMRCIRCKNKEICMLFVAEQLLVGVKQSLFIDL